MKNLFDLTNKVALVTGASSGMGQAIAEAMGVHGAKVIVASNDTEGVQKTVASFKKKFGTKVGEVSSAKVGEVLNLPDLERSENCDNIIGFTCDMSKKQDIDRLYEAAISKFGKIDILVNCVGLAPTGGLMDIKSTDFEATMGLNLQAAIYLTKLVVPNMQAQKDGVLIYLASIAGVRGNKNLGLYGVSKAGGFITGQNIIIDGGTTISDGN